MSSTESSNRLTKFLNQIQVVMVNTTLPANIGSAARAMHTMGLAHLTVVAPKHPIDDDAIAHAAGASHILDTVNIVNTLEQAISDCQWVFATSSRQRHIPKPVMTPRQAAASMLDYFDSCFNNLSHHHNLPTSPSIALVFGREDRGLTNDELQLADYHIQIPANPNYSVLNVAAAVQVITSVFYEMAEMHFGKAEISSNSPSSDTNKKSLDGSCADALANVNACELSDNEVAILLRQTWDAPAITQAQKQQLETRLLTLLTQLNIYHPDQSKVMPQRVSRLLGRLQLDVKEYQLLQAAIAKLLKP